MRSFPLTTSRWAIAVLLAAGSATPALRAQSADSSALPPNYWRRFSYGFAASILFHEAGHIVTAVAVGGHPSFGFLDIPHSRGGAFERGMLGGGIGTTLFYLTIGRRGSVSDVDFMARTHALSATQITLIFGSIAALHTIRISRDPHYANFFARPRADGKIDVGLELSAP